MSDNVQGWKPDLYVVARLLERLRRNEGPELKTRLQVGTNLNYQAFSKYLDWLLERELVQLEELDSGREGVVLSPRGQEAYRKLWEWIDAILQPTRSRDGGKR